MALIKEVVSVTGVRCRFFDDCIRTDPKAIKAIEETQKQLIYKVYADAERKKRAETQA